MKIRTEEFMILKVAVGIVEHHADDLTEIEKRVLDRALRSIENAETRHNESNEKQARYMMERRKKLQEGA